ncbi:MAG TPA: hypothetical protein VEI97_05705, partial [bacterium]|nr:hypothetical protein [bacterium]
VTLTLTPLETTTGDLPGRLVAGAQIDPAGVLFAQAATLRITPASALSNGPVGMKLGPAAPAGSRALTAATEPSLTVTIPVCQNGSLRAVEVPISAGTTAALIDGTTQTLQVMQNRAPTNLCLQMENAFAVQSLARLLANPCGPQDDDFGPLLNDLFLTVVNPVLTAAPTDDTRFREALDLYTCWLALVLAAGEDEGRLLRALIEGGKANLSNAANRMVQGVPGRCAAHDLTAAKDVVDILALLLAEFIDPGASRPLLTQATLLQRYSDCMQFRIRGSWLVDHTVMEGQVLTVDIRATLDFETPRFGPAPTDPTTVEFGAGTFTHSFSRWSWMNNQGLAVFTTDLAGYGTATGCGPAPPLPPFNIDVEVQRLNPYSLLDPAGLDVITLLSAAGHDFRCSRFTGMCGPEPCGPMLMDVPEQMRASARRPQDSILQLGTWVPGEGGEKVARIDFLNGFQSGNDPIVGETEERWRLELIHVVP